MTEVLFTAAAGAAAFIAVLTPAGRTSPPTHEESDYIIGKDLSNKNRLKEDILR
jgi:hypothetical protein